MDNPSYEEQTRRNPEFSTGERLAAIESLLKTFATAAELADLRALMEGHWRLDLETERSTREEINVQRAERREEIDSVRRELVTSIQAQDKAINKAEEAQLRQAELTREQADRREEIANQRLLALERGESSGEGRQVRGKEIVAYAFSVAVIVVALAGVIAAVLSH